MKNLFFLTILFILSCHPYKQECLSAENHLKELDCISKTNPFTKKGKSFGEFCEETQENGIKLNTSCLINIKACDEMDICTNSKRK